MPARCWWGNKELFYLKNPQTKGRARPANNWLLVTCLTNINVLNLKVFLKHSMLYSYGVLGKLNGSSSSCYSLRIGGWEGKEWECPTEHSEGRTRRRGSDSEVSPPPPWLCQAGVGPGARSHAEPLPAPCNPSLCSSSLTAGPVPRNYWQKVLDSEEWNVCVGPSMASKRRGALAAKEEAVLSTRNDRPLVHTIQSSSTLAHPLSIERKHRESTDM